MTKSIEELVNQPVQKMIVTDVKIDRNETPIGMAALYLQIQREDGQTSGLSMTFKMGDSITSVADQFDWMSRWLNRIAGTKLT